MIGGDDEELHFALEGDEEQELTEHEDEEEQIDIPDIVVSGESSRVRRFWFNTVDNVEHRVDHARLLKGHTRRQRVELHERCLKLIAFCFLRSDL